MSLGTMTSRILGLGRDVAMAALFDRRVTDAWTAAFRLPNLFRRLFGEGSLSVSFIPLFVDLRVQDSSERRARNLVNGFYTLLLLAMAVLTLWGLFFMEPLLRWILDRSYQLDQEKFALTVQMARIMFGFVFFVVSYAYFMGILQALGEFTWPALAPAVFNLTMLVFTFLPDTWFRQHGGGLAWGVLVGGFLQAFVLVPVLQNKNYFPRIVWKGLSEDMRRLLARMGPGLIGMGLVQFMAIVNLHFASRLGEGVLSAIYWADRLLELPLSLVAVSLSSALLPTLSELWSRGRREEIFQTAGEQLIVNGFWVVPSAVGMFVLAGPLVEVLFMRGHFSAEDLRRTTEVLQIYAGSLLALSLVRLLLPMLYAAHRVWGALLCTGISLLVHLLIAPLWMKTAGLQGLIYSTLFSSILNLLLVFLLVVVTLGRPSWGVVVKKYAQFFLLSAGIALCGVLFSWLKGVSGSPLLALLVCLIFSALTYFGLGRAFRVHELFYLEKFKRA